VYSDLVMHRRFRALGRRLRGGVAGCLFGGAMLVPLGPTTTSQAVNQMNATSMRGVPSVASRPVARDAMIWVPGRVVRLPGEGVVTVPGHWERRLPDTREVHVPPLTVRNPATGDSIALPAAVRPPVEERLGP
jgi:hypothetical protein